VIFASRSTSQQYIAICYIHASTNLLKSQVLDIFHKVCLAS